MRRKEVGIISVPPGVFISVSEKRAADILALKRGADITFLPPNRHKGQKTPDIQMEGVLWEIKSPRGRSPRVIENNLRTALRQSPRIILDLRHLDGRTPTEKRLTEVARQFSLAKSIKHIIVITRQGEIVDFQR